MKGPCQLKGIISNNRCPPFMGQIRGSPLVYHSRFFQYMLADNEMLAVTFVNSRCTV